MRVKRVLVLMALLLIIMGTAVFAVEPSVAFGGDDTVNLGGTKTVTVIVKAENSASVVSGKITKSGKIDRISLSAKNGWNLTAYNETTGEFNITKATGAKEEVFMEVSYTASNTKGEGTITISNVKVTTIDYETKDLADVMKNIEVKENAVNPTPTPTPLPDPSPTPTANPSPTPTQKPSPSPVPTQKPTPAPIQNPGNNGQNGKDDTTAKGKLSQTGVKKAILYVVPRTIERIEIARQANKTSYFVGENLTAGKNSMTISYTENGVTKTTTQAIVVMASLEINLGDLNAKADGKKIYIEGSKPNTNLNAVKEEITTNGKVEIFKGTQKITNFNTKTATGMKLKISLNDEKAEYEIVVIGDLLGNGDMGDGDLLKMARYKVGLDKNLPGAYLRASDITGDGKVAEDGDLLKMERVLAKLDNI